MTVTRSEFIELGPVKMVPGTCPTLPLIRLADLSPRVHALHVGDTLDGFQFGQITEDETRTRLLALGFTEASAERAIAFRRRRQAFRIATEAKP